MFLICPRAGCKKYVTQLHLVTFLTASTRGGSRKLRKRGGAQLPLPSSPSFSLPSPPLRSTPPLIQLGGLGQSPGHKSNFGIFGAQEKASDGKDLGSSSALNFFQNLP